MDGNSIHIAVDPALGASSWGEFHDVKISPTQPLYIQQPEKTNFHFGRCCKHLRSNNYICTYVCAIFSIGSGIAGGYTISNFMLSNELPNKNVETFTACGLGNVIALAMVGGGVLAIVNIFRKAIKKGKSNEADPLLIPV